MDSQLELRRQIRACRNCPLGEHESGPIPFAAYQEPAHILVIGEAPGRQEARQVAPFVGPAGQLAREWLWRGFRQLGPRDPAEADSEAPSVVWANVVQCWPARRYPKPLPEEIVACRPNLEAIIWYVRPRYLLLFGGVALNAFLPGKNISDWRGMWWKARVVKGKDKHEMWAMSTYHPSFVLRNRYMNDTVQTDINAFCFYSRGWFDPPAEELVIKKGKKKGQVQHWQQEKLV